MDQNFGNDEEQEFYGLQDGDIIIQQENDQESQNQNNQLDPRLIINECLGQFKTVVTTGNTQNVLGDNQIEVEKQQNKGNQQNHYKFELTMLIEIMKNLKDPQNKILMDKNLIFQVQQYIENNQEEKEDFQYEIFIKLKSFQDSDLQSNNFKQYPHIITMHIDFQLPSENELFLLKYTKTQTISYWNNNINKKKKDEAEFEFKKIGYLFHFENITKLDKLKSKFKQKCQELQQAIEQLENQIQQKQNNNDKTDQLELQSLQQQLLYEEFEFNYYDIALYPMSGCFKSQSVLLKRSRYQQNQQTELIAQKTFKDLELSDIQRLLHGQIKDELDERRPEGKSVNVEREIKFIYDLKKKKKEHDLIIKLKGFVINETNQQAKINLEYFGGIEFNGSTVNDFFYQKKFHQDLGCENFEQIEYFLSQIFFQAVEGVEIFHKSQKVLRDFKDDNILMIRINNDEVRCKLIDFGLIGNLDSNPSLEFYSKNDFRDNEICDNYNQNKIYYAAYDIYSLGIFLQKLYLLYFHCFENRYQGKIKNPIMDFDLAQQLVSKMVAKRSQRPESIEDLKKTDQYKNYFTQKEEYHKKKKNNQQNYNEQQQQQQLRNEIQLEQLQINGQQQ